MDISSIIIQIFKTLGLNNAAEAAGWVVALLSVGFLVWRINIIDKKYDNYVEKISDIIEKKDDEWRTLIKRQDELMYNMLEDTTKTMTALSERISAFELLLLQVKRD